MRLELIGGEANEPARLMAKASKAYAVHRHVCIIDVAEMYVDYVKMTVLQHGAKNTNM